MEWGQDTRQNQNVYQRIIHLLLTQNFPENEHLPPDMQTRVCVSGSKC